MAGSLVNISIRGKTWTVPAGLNTIQAMWYCGFDLTHGVGCLGGVCGACTITYQIGDSPVKTALGCQTLVLDGMSFSLYPADVQRSVPYQLPLNKNKEMTSPSLKTHFTDTLSSTRRCVSCGACTLVCPQEIDAMKGVKEALNGNFKPVSDLFLNCVMCGLCASVCEVKVLPHLVGLYSRKVTSFYLTDDTRQLQQRIEEIQSGQYDGEWSRLLKLKENDWKKEEFV